MELKHLFIDMDGVLSCFDNDRGKVITDVSEFTKEFFATRLPVWDMIYNIRVLFPETEYVYHVLSNSPNKESTEGKNLFLDKYFPIPYENRHFIEWSPDKKQCKSNFIVDYIFENDIKIENVAFIDDDYNNLVDVETLNVDCYHPSKVLTMGRRKSAKAIFD